jgi:hypothetical protein
LTIKAIIPSASLTVYQHPYWWESWLMIHANVPSISLLPTAWITFQPIEVPINYVSREPFNEVARQVQTMQNWIYGLMIAMAIVLMIPALGLFWYYLSHQLLLDHDRIRLFMSYGASEEMIHQWYITKLVLLILEIYMPSMILFLSFDFLMKSQIYKQFYLATTPTFPSISLIIFSLIFMLIYYWMKWLVVLKVRKVMSRNLN